MLTQALRGLYAVAENYPELKANQNFMALQQSLTQTEDAISGSRRSYNSAVQELNTKIETVPSNLIASMFNFKPREFFEIKDEAERAVPQVRLLALLVQVSRVQVTKSPVEVRHAAVTAGHPLGAAVGAEVLRRGGNAVDAAVATAFAMAVVEPFMSCLAGGGSMLIHRPRRGESVALDFNVEAPAAAHARMYPLGGGRGSDLFPWRAVEGDANVHGHRAVAVPGSVAGLALALERYGTLRPPRRRRARGAPGPPRRAGRLVPRADHRLARRGAVALPGSGADLPARRALGAAAPAPRARRPVAPARAGPDARADREGGARRLLPRRAGRGHRRRDAAGRGRPDAGGPRGVSRAGRRAARGHVPRRAAPRHAGRHRLRHRAGGAERPRLLRPAARRRRRRPDVPPAGRARSAWPSPTGSAGWATRRTSTRRGTGCSRRRTRPASPVAWTAEAGGRRAAGERARATARPTSAPWTATGRWSP